jgi:transcriptional regulator with XRE-family HTH domain
MTSVDVLFNDAFTKDELRRLRYRLGWSQAEMARNLKLELVTLAGFESGATVIPLTLKSSLVRISQTADSNAECTQRRAIAETLMDERKLSQIHNFECDPSAVAQKGRA